MDLITDEDAIDFDVEAAFDEWFTPNRTSAYNPRSTRTRADWAVVVQNGNIKLPPPQWWLEEQDTKGRQKSKFAIWNSRYTYGRQLSIWMLAPLEDFRRAKFLRKSNEYT